MKNNLILYILLVFLVAVNGFFLYNYLSPTTAKSNNLVKGSGNGGPSEFIVKALKFDDEQMKQFEKIDKEHHERMVASNEETKVFKDQLGRLIIKDHVAEAEVDSILNLMGEKEMVHERLMFDHLRAIRNICTEEQKQRFEQIVRDALRRGPNGKRPGNGGPPPRDGRPQGGPPPENMPEGGPPPRPE
ncbi:Spy/CpxP family protein refolding chaperone [Mariniflexile gromovii]|uniref:Spy/CpxP family protein refolding chaperone n=1 Tax=Mariniflexile gromovii TaxID=362523 RepID=A0ABS4BTJ1_9FLAO|nr:Spy/CpxP family protein refolding chaperone [Mariniflexile gromovii]MBP0903326.1 Spy/CpxP family protein refolding chaperone [Mariniflexile gromovii]